MRRPRTMKVREIMRLLRAAGFTYTRSRATHEQWHHADGRRVTIQNARDEISGATLEDVWRQIFTPEQRAG